MPSQHTSSVAVVGMACRLPGGATDPERLWTLLAEARNCWTDVPLTRYNEKAFHRPESDSNGPHMHAGGHFVTQNIAAFDAGFFNISPAEANAMDPQQRILLETTYEALENGGLKMDEIQGSRTAVYMAMFSHDYDKNLYKDPNDLPKYQLTGSGEAIVSNRISYVFDFRGPSMTLDTGCSGSLVALHLACQSLRTGECDMALVGGVNLILGPDQTIALDCARMLNSQGRSFPFDIRGSGYGRGEGSTTVVLKRLEDAIQTGSPVRAIIRSTAVNQDGKTTGITHPNEKAQEELMRSVYANAGIEPHEVGYVEAHGTGTLAGDVAETRAIAEVFCIDRDSSLCVGSIKSNIGHIESASGLAGLIKAVLVLEKGVIPPNADFREPKPDLYLPQRKLMIPSKLEQLQRPIVSINSFGYGGTNAHAVLERYTRPIRHTYAQPENTSLESKTDSIVGRKIAHQEALPPRLFIMSAKTETSLLAAVRGLLDWISKKDDNVDLRGLALTFASHRSIFGWRFAFVASNHQEITSILAQGRKVSKASSGPQICFLFSGQGAQWYGMGRELISMHSSFKDSILKSGAILRDLGATWDLVSALTLNKSEAPFSIHESKIAQPAITALQIALVNVLRGIGIRPQAVIGHSSGEIAAGYCAGAISHADALRISYHRGLISTRAGSMLAIGLGEDDVLEHLSGTPEKFETVSVACVNSISNTTVSGSEEDIIALKNSLDRLSIFNVKLNVNIAYHSPHLRTASTLYSENLDGIQSSESEESVHFISCVTAKRKRSHFGAKYWAESLWSKVRYHDALREYFRIRKEDSQPIDRQGSKIMIEIGPDSVLAGSTRQTIRENSDSVDYSYYSTLSKGNNAVEAMLSLAGRLFEHGASVNFDGIQTLCSPQAGGNIVQSLPPYSWDHSNEYWHESRLSKDYRFRRSPPHELLGLRMLDSNTLEPRWRNFISLDGVPWLVDHVVDGLVIFPGAAYICMAIEAVCEVLEFRPSNTHAVCSMRDILFLRALVVPPAPGKVEIHLSLSVTLGEDTGSGSIWREFRITSLSKEGNWTQNCCGKIKFNVSAPRNYNDEVGPYLDHETTKELALSGFQGLDHQVISSEELYETLEANGNYYGAHFTAIEKLQVRDTNLAIARVIIPRFPSRTSTLNYNQFSIVHPITLDALMHSSLPLYTFQKGPGSIMPISMEELTITSSLESRPGKPILGKTILVSEGPRLATADIMGFNADQSAESGPALIISGMGLRGLGDVPRQYPDVLGISYQMEWGPDPDHIRLPHAQSITPTGFDKSQAKKLGSLNKAASVYIYNTIEQLTTDGLHTFQNHYSVFWSWMKKQIAFSGFDTNNTADSSFEMLLKESSNEGIEGEMLRRIGQNLSTILSGGIDPLQMMLDGDLLSKYYTADSSARCYPYVRHYVENLIFHNPHMSILEIGAGTAGTTIEVFKAMTTNYKSQLASYQFTDISAGFFERAREILRDWIEVISFSKLNIEVNPMDQGYTAHCYDLVIAANVLHATRSIDQTLQNVHKLLKPGGKLILVEATQAQTFLGVIFGTLPGWWRGIDEGREDGPLLTQEQWHCALLRNGFSGVDISGHDTDGPGHIATMMVSKALHSSASEMYYPISLVVEDEELVSQMPLPIDTIFQALKKRGFQVSFASWQSSLSRKDVIYIIQDCGRQALLVKPTPSRFKKIAQLVTEASNVLWISTQEDVNALMNAEKSLVTGLARSAHAENEDLNLVTLNVQQAFNDSPKLLIRNIIEVLLRSFGASSDSVFREREYVYRDHQLLIPRLIPNAALEEWLGHASGKHKTEVRMYGQPQRPLKMMIDKNQSGRGFGFVNDERLDEEVKPFEAEIDVRAFGVSERDAMILPRQTKSHLVMGECAGVVTALSSSSSTNLSIGDRVCAIGGTPYSNRIRIPSNHVFPIPAEMSFSTAASVPLAFLTAHHTLFRIAGIRQDQTILVHTGTGSIGQAAILLAQSAGAGVLATVAHKADRELLIERFGIPSKCIFVDEEGSLNNDLLRWTRGKNIDILLHCSQKAIEAGIFGCLRPCGTLIHVNSTPGSPKASINTLSLRENVTFVLFEPVIFIRDRPDEAMESIADVLSQFRSGDIKPRHCVTVFSVAAIDSAFKSIQAESTIGKVVVETTQTSKVKVLDVTRLAINLKGDATYVIAGGLGDFGRRISRLMVTRGARNIFVLSRRRLIAEDTRMIETELQSIAAETRFHSEQCNIADAPQVRAAIKSIIDRGFPSVKGVVQAASVLHDIPLWKMELANFQIPLETKYYGTKHLIEALQATPLDFFLNLSSTSSIVGARSCANYGAGNCFQDALAQFHEPSKTRYVSANIGGMVKGAAVNNEVQERNLREQGLLTITSEQLLALLEYAMSPGCCKQPVIGFNHISLSQAKVPNATPRTAMFNHVWHSAESTDRNNDKEVIEPLRIKLSKMEKPADQYQIILTAIAGKISDLVAIDRNNVKPDSSIAELGLDSLITIELKNWIAKEFGIAIQASEILDQKSVFALATTLISRSDNVERIREPNENWEIKSYRSNGIQELPLKWHFPPSHKSEPYLPLPDLEETLQMYMTMRQCFLSPEQIAHTKSAIRSLLQEGGLGRTLQDRLVARTKDVNIDNWQSHPYAQNIYLARRDPIHPFMTFFGGHPLPKPGHDQADRAATISFAAFSFMRQVESGTIEQNTLSGEPACMDSLQWLFNACRKPAVGIDEMQKSPGNNFLVALRRGHLVQMHLEENGQQLAQTRLKTMFQLVLECTEAELPSVATLTAGERNWWAEVRKEVLSTDATNAQNLKKIEAAAFIVCLDDGNPSTPSERCNQFFLGDPSNRWSDKTLQFVVCENAVSAFVGEHAMLDGLSVTQLNRFVSRAILAHEDREERGSTPNSEERKDFLISGLRGQAAIGDYTNSLATELTLITTPKIKKDIHQIRERFSKEHTPIEFCHFRVSAFGRTFLRKHRCPSKTAYQLVIQLACLLYYGYNPPAWETIAMARFHKGRVDWLQIVQPAVAAFCTAARDGSIPLAEQRVLFFRAANTHVNAMTRIARGHGFKAHLHALLAMLREEEEMPEFFKDKSWQDTKVQSTKIVKTDCLEGLMVEEMAFLMPRPECIFLHYEVQDEGCLFFVQAWPNKTNLICDALHEAAIKVKIILESKTGVAS